MTNAIKVVLLVLIISIILISCTSETGNNKIIDNNFNEDNNHNDYDSNESKEETKYEYMTVYTSIKDQQMTGTCWTYSTLSFLESEVIRKNTALRDIDLSEMFVVYYTYIEKAREFLRRMGDNPFTEGGLDYDAMLVLSKYGIVRNSDYPAKNESYHRSVVNTMRDILEETLSQYKDDGEIPEEVIEDTINKISRELDDYFGKIPETLQVDGKTLTPVEYARDILKLDREDYITVTSFTHLPLYEYSELGIPDNWQHFDKYINVELKEMTDIAKNSLRKGYSISIDADVTEPNINMVKGYFILNKNERIDDYKKLVEIRQNQYDNGSTTDDHAMHIVGLDENVDEFSLGVYPEEEEIDWYYMKNSWGRRAGDKGFMHMSEYYFNMKVLAITVHKDILEDFEYILPTEN